MTLPPKKTPLLPKGSSFIVMGVSGCGKSTIGAALAQQIAAKFLDGDDLQPRANILKMSAGQPLNDEDRQPWLVRIRDAVFSIEKKNERGVIVCSALKKQYRDIIREGNQQVTFLHLHGNMELIQQRMAQRSGHFMPPQLLESQFSALELPDASETDVKTIKIDAGLDEVIAQCICKING